MGTHASHLGPMVETMNSCATKESPNIAGKARKAVKRSILRNTRVSCSLILCSSLAADRSPLTSTSTGCATCSILPLTNWYAIVFHLNAWKKLPTTCGVLANNFPKIKVRMLLLRVLITIVTRMFIANLQVRRIGVKSIDNEGLQGTKKKRPMTSIRAFTTCCHARLQ